MKRAYPGLSSKGWVEDPPSVLDSVMSNFLLTHPSLNLDYSASIKSLPDIVQKFGNDENDIRREMKLALEELLQRWFDSAVVDVRITYPFPDDDTRMGINVYASVDTNGKSYNVAKELSLANGKVALVMGINNG